MARKKRDRAEKPAQASAAPVNARPSGRQSSDDTLPVELRPLADAAAVPGFWPVAAICVTACAGLLINQYGGSEQTFALLFPPRYIDPYWVLRVKAWWVGSILIGFVALPGLVMAVLPGARAFRRLRGRNAIGRRIRHRPPLRP